jgi:hypothetical protein
MAQAAAPTVSSVRIGVSSYGPNVSPLTVSPNIATNYFINGTVSDTDGYTDIVSVAAVLYRSGVANGADCTADNNNCYRPAICNLSNGSGNNVDYSCAVALQYYTDPTDTGTYASESWKVRIRVTDSSQSVDDSAYNTELNSLLAISISPSNINYGNQSLGATSNSVRVDVKNSGNVAADSAVSAAGNLTCAIGSILVANQKYGRTDVAYGSLEYTLSTSPANAGLTLPAQTDDFTAVIDELYFRILVPSSGVRGNCNGTTNINAVGI